MPNPREFPNGLPSCPSLEQLDQYHSGRLPAAEALAVARHLAACPACAAAFDAATVVSPPRSTARPVATLREAPAPLPPPALEPPVLFGKYRVVRKLAEGGMGVVYEAREEPLERPVALKLVRCGWLAGDAALRRFRTEARAITRLDHPHIVRIYDYDEFGGSPYFTMELMPGGSLADRLQGRPLPEREAAMLVETLARAVQYAHDHRVLHRDLKPANVLLTADDTPKLSDFGLAKLLDADGGQTHTDAVMGTPSYMSPEQAGGDAKKVGPASDVYSLGAIFYEVLTGQPPFRGQTRTETLELVRTTAPRPPAELRPGLSPALEAICLKCLEKDPRDRYASAGQLADRLRSFLDGKPIAERPPGWLNKTWRSLRRHPLAAAAVVLLAVVCVSGLLAARYLRPESPRAEIQSRMKKDGRYEFKGTEPLPGPWSWFGKESGKIRSNPEDECFTITTLGIALVELTPDTGCDRYLFSAEVRHDNAVNVASRVGLYFGGRDVGVAGGPRFRSYYSFSLSDRDNPQARDPKDQKGGKAGQEPEHGAKLRYTCSAADVAADPARVSSLLSGKPVKFPAANPNPNPAPWRTLTLEITPDGVRAIGPAGEKEKPLDADADFLRGRQKRLADDLSTPQGVPVEFRHRGGIGLIVVCGEASFRHVVLKRLPEEK